MSRPSRDIAKAIDRLEWDAVDSGTPLVPLAELAGPRSISGTGEGRLREYITRGLGGVHLDAVLRRGEWLSHPLALVRFCLEVAAEDYDREERMRSAGAVEADVSAGVRGGLAGEVEAVRWQKSAARVSRPSRCGRGTPPGRQGPPRPGRA